MHRQLIAALCCWIAEDYAHLSGTESGTDGDAAHMNTPAAPPSALLPQPLLPQPLLPPPAMLSCEPAIIIV